MRCLGRNKNGRRCNNQAVFFFCLLHRKQFILLLLVTLPALVGLYAGIYQDILKPLQTIKSSENPALENQIQNLSEIENSLQNLSDFIEVQKRSLIASDETLKKLRSEERKLKPVIDANRNVIESIFELQNEKYRNRVWLDRFIGFCIGISASLIASFIYQFLGNLKSSEKSNNVEKDVDLPSEKED